MQLSTKKLDQLTFTRFLAALSVLLYHSGRGVGFLQYVPFLTSGQTAVSYFYVLSGFVMAYVYYRPEMQFNFRNYALARFSRIYPVYIFSFIVTCLYLIKIVPKTETGEILSNIFLYQAWIPEYANSFNIAAWSLSVEVFFYFLLPFLVFFALKQPVKKLIWYSLGFWAFSQLIHSVWFISTAPERPMFFLSFFPLFHFNAFFIGFAGGVWYLNRPVEQRLSGIVKFILLVLPLVIVIMGLYFRDVQHAFGNTFYLDAGLFAPVFLIFILTLASDSSKISRALSHPGLVLLGDASYAIYILHVPLRWGLQNILASLSISLSQEAFLLIYVPIAIILCVLIYKYFEVLAQAWLRHHSHKLFFLFLDVTLIAIMIKLTFVLRFGLSGIDFLRTQRFAIFFGTVIFFVLLIVFQFYTTYSWRRLGLAVFFGAIILTGFVYYAWQKEWVEGFPRPILAAIPFFIFFSIYISRSLLQFSFGMRQSKHKP